ncbi:MAG: hypothetical protein QF593_08750, partial [Nitrospinota bacterium]|nr:hypothetical protein [Nitrospinota bacterium]
MDLHRDPVFRAEPAADGGGPHADLLHRDTERPGDLAAVGEGVLGPGFHNQDVPPLPPLPPLPLHAGHARFGLNEGRRLPGGLEGVLDDDIRLG